MKPESKPTFDAAVAPTLLVEAGDLSPAAAQAFVGYWVEALNFAGQTGRTHALREASSPSCSTCQELITGIERLHGAGGYYRGDAWSLGGMEYLPSHPETQPVIEGDVEVVSGVVAGGPGGGARLFDDGKHALIFWLDRSRTGESWVVRQLESQ